MLITLFQIYMLLHLFIQCSVIKKISDLCIITLLRSIPLDNCALTKILGSPLDSQLFQPGCPPLKVAHPQKIIKLIKFLEIFINSNYYEPCNLSFFQITCSHNFLKLLKPITCTYSKKNSLKMKEKSYAKEFWAVMSEGSVQCQVCTLFCFTIICPQELPFCVVWFLEVSLIKKNWFIFSQ